jgi:hypothetical protein
MPSRHSPLTRLALMLACRQVIENYKRQSVEGLALPFLANWLFGALRRDVPAGIRSEHPLHSGDITNLVGCILTHQLPFQTVSAP